MMFHPNSNKIHRLQKRIAETDLTEKYKHGVPQMATCRRECGCYGNCIDVYSRTGVSTFVPLSGAALVYRNGKLEEVIPIGAMNILL